MGMPPTFTVLRFVSSSSSSLTNTYSSGRLSLPVIGSVAAFRLAGVEPTVINNVTGIPMLESQLTTRLAEMGVNSGPDFFPFIWGQTMTVPVERIKLPLPTNATKTGPVIDSGILAYRLNKITRTRTGQ